jgi:hypothetical protein
MNKNLLKYIACFAIGTLLYSCNESEGDLLEAKVYFEESKVSIETSDDDVLTYNLQARISSQYSSPVEITYAIADASAVEDYNSQHGTNYVAFDTSKANMETQSVTIGAGEIYAPNVAVKMSGINDAEEGKTYVLPVRIQSASLPIIDRSGIAYLVISKPVKITTAASFYSSYIQIPVSASTPFTSITYEALINASDLFDNNTIMGTEGTLILRIGDPALPDGHNDWMQIAGEKQFHSSQSFATNKWYHVAFTYNQPSGKAVLYINGEKVSENTWDTASFDLSTSPGCFVGKVKDFMWGERPFYGTMSEVRLWRVARTENQIKQNMLSVDPESDGLAAYYKLNGTDLIQKDEMSYIKDASGNNMDGATNIRSFKKLDTPISVK